MKKEKQKPSFGKEARKIGSGFTGIFRAIPTWVYLVFIPFVVVIGGVLAYAISETSPLRLPVNQIVNNQLLTSTYAYDGRTKEPVYVLQVITAPETHESLTDIKFVEDTTIPAIIRSKISDYQNSGFDMAHLLNIADQGLFDTEFPLSTVSPQLPGFNKGYWAKVDNYVIELVRKVDWMRTLVITGPLYLPHDASDGKRYVTYQVIGEGDVAVPTHFFKAIFYPVGIPDRSGFTVSSEIYVIPNEDLDESIPLDSFKTSLEELERISGIIFPTDIRSYIKLLPPPPPF